MDKSKQFKLGFLINPIAGIGGKTGLKGSDGLKTIRKAFSMGAEKESESRAEEALLQLKFLKDKFFLVTCAETGPGEILQIFFNNMIGFSFSFVRSTGLVVTP